jgi:hypothetical protein
MGRSGEFDAELAKDAHRAVAEGFEQLNEIGIPAGGSRRGSARRVEHDLGRTLNDSLDGHNGHGASQLPHGEQLSIGP